MRKRGRPPRSYKPLVDCGCVRLDVTTLWNGGGLNSQGRPFVWSDGDGNKVASIHIMQDEQYCITLTYTISSEGVPVKSVIENVELATTPCHFGGERVWFVCPGCGARTRYLAAGDRFRCSTCYPVRYPSQVLSRRENRRRKLYRLLQVDLREPLSRVRPPGRMRMDRFRPLLLELLRIEGQMSREVMAMSASSEKHDN